MSHVLIAGYGALGKVVASLLISAGYQVTALSRQPKEIPPGIDFIQGDLTQIRSDQLPKAIDWVIYCAAADNHSEEAYTNAYLQGVKQLLNKLQRKPLQGFFFISSTGVYGQDQGQVVTEGSETKPTQFSGKILLAAEQQVQQSGISHCCLRFSGIYGPGRTYLLRKICEGGLLAEPGQHFTNRIHIEDGAGFIVHLIQQGSFLPIYNVSDSKPCLKREVVEWIGTQLGKSFPDEAPTNKVTGKQVSNQRLLETGYQLKYPDYKAGYTPLLGEYSFRIDT